MSRPIQNSLVAAAAALAVFSAPVAASAVEYLVGHRLSSSNYRNGVGKAFRIVIKAGQDGNAPAFLLPPDPAGTANLVSIQRELGMVSDPLTAGTWQGLGSPAGSKGWKYRNKNAPVGGEVKLLLVKEKVVKVVAKGTGGMPDPATPNGLLTAVIVLGDDSYCAEATPPHFKEIDGKLIRSKQQLAPAACASTCVLGNDSDFDRLDDCFETNSGIFVDSSDTGTDPLEEDTDQDGIPDGDEVLGTLAGLDLPALGVNPLRRDILVEYDWFEDSLECGFHSHEPSDVSLDMVTAMFDGAPVANPDGSTGINFIHDRGQGGALTGGSLIPDADGNLGGDTFWSDAEFDGHKAANFAPNRENYFHYAVLPHRYVGFLEGGPTTGGQAELGGDDFILASACGYSDTTWIGYVIAHEMGHNLNLWHGGPPGNACNYKPNYNSIMNYRYLSLLSGIDSDCIPGGEGELDYSIGDRISLDENNLDENQGTCGPGFPRDWDGNGMIENGVAWDVNPPVPFDPFQQLQNEGLCGGKFTVLSDYDDWGNIQLEKVMDLDGIEPRSPNLVISCDFPLTGP